VQRIASTAGALLTPRDPKWLTLQCDTRGAGRRSRTRSQRIAAIPRSRSQSSARFSMAHLFRHFAIPQPAMADHVPRARDGCPHRQ
jgi:hypothetical protein